MRRCVYLCAGARSTMVQGTCGRTKALSDENVLTGLIRLTSPSANCQVADPSQFVIGIALKELLLSHFKTVYRLLVIC